MLKSWNKINLEQYGLTAISRLQSNPNYWVYGTLSKNKRNSILELREKGYYASGVHINNNRYSVFKDSSKLLGVEKFYESFIALPSGWWVNDICL